MSMMSIPLNASSANTYSNIKTLEEYRIRIGEDAKDNIVEIKKG